MIREKLCSLKSAVGVTMLAGIRSRADCSPAARLGKTFGGGGCGHRAGERRRVFDEISRDSRVQGRRFLKCAMQTLFLALGCKTAFCRLVARNLR